MQISKLTPTIQKTIIPDIWGFDIETYGKDNNFYCASFWNESDKKIFFNKNDIVHFVKSERLRSSFIAATNLSFDFFGVYDGHDDIRFFKTLFRGSSLLTAKRREKKNTVTFIDTGNYANLSVEKLGKLLKLPKLNKPACLGRLPKNENEKRELLVYNMRDAEISGRALRFFYKSFHRIGATPKVTLASTAMSLFRNKYLSNVYYRHPIHVLDKQFLGYYGGRTEAFSRGIFENYYYYDVNSLYPSVMMNEFPDPNTLRINKKNTTEYIEGTEGMSHVTIHCPYMEYPLLPFRHDNKLLFPIGTFTGWYCHNELRKAISLGYVIKRVHECHWYNGTCRPFDEYVKSLYHLRKSSSNEQMSFIYKILMNALYGKFGQKYRGKDNVIPLNHTVEQLSQLTEFEILGNYIRIKKDRIPSCFCIPVWAAYVTAYARMVMHNLIVRTRPLYTDTDSIITRKKLMDSDALGKLKCELFIEKGIIVKPKLYAIQGTETRVKAKGIGTKLVWKDFERLLMDGKISYTKFMKFRESLRRKLPVNAIQDITKHLDLEDNKRQWERLFSSLELQHSAPLDMQKGKVYKEIKLSVSH